MQLTPVMNLFTTVQVKFYYELYSWLFSKLHIFQYRLRTNGGGPDDEALFIQKLTPTKVLLIQASNGERVAEIQSTDDSAFVAFCEHDCDNSTTRSSSGTSNLLFSGHDNGVIQMWDLQTAGVVFKKGHGKGQESNASLNGHEMAKLIDSSRRLQL